MSIMEADHPVEITQTRKGWWARTWHSIWDPIKPGKEAGRGAYWAALATVIWAAIVGGLNVNSGFGLWADFAFAFVIAALGIPLVALAVVLLLTIFRRLPRLLSGFFVGAFLAISLLWRSSYGYWTSGILLVLECVLGAAVATLLFGGIRRTSPAKRILTISLIVLAVAGNLLVFNFFHSDGVNEEVIRLDKNPAPLPPKLSAANPSQPGSYAVKTLTYGNGDDIRRPEYGKAVAIHTGTVDASKFFKDFKGWKANIRQLYWGFGMDKLPINGRVWYPEGPGPFPLVLIVHGNHGMAQFSDPGYAYLGNLMASRGFIFASIDENFLNSGLYHDPPKQQAARGWMLLEHLKTWRKWNATAGNPFYKKIDVDNVALMGHSRGGEAVATAVLFNKLAYYPDDATIQFHYGFPIKAIVAIAPVDGQYKPAGQWRWIQDVNYFTIHGSNDGDVSSFQGSRQFDHLRFSGHGDYFKSELYIYRANHGQFNTSWGRTDHGAPSNWLLNLRSLLPGDDQRQIAKVYISAFLEATLHNRREYIPLFQDYRTVRDWVPHTLYVNRYLDNSNKVVSDFSEDADVTTTTVPGGVLQEKNLTLWHEGKIPYRNGDRDYNGVFLGWNRTYAKGSPVPPPASYSIDLPPTLPGDWKLGKQSLLTMSIAVTEDNAPPADKKLKKKKLEDEENDDKPTPTDFTIVMETRDGATVKLPLSQFNLLLPPLKVKLTKLEYLNKDMYKVESEPVFQSVRVPLEAFAKQDAHFDPAKLKTVRLLFDRTPSRVIIISAVGFSEPPRYN
jgi:dienelactone hydrolase